MFSDFGYIFTWWLVFFGIGLISLPLTRKIFSNFFDQGYLFSKVIGIAVSSYLVWLLASLKILPFYKETIWLVLIIGLIINLLTIRKSPKHPQSSKKSLIANHPLRREASQLLITFVLEEVMFFATLTFWSYIRGFQPDIQGLEKFMDFGFVNSILRTKYFPPADMWFAGKYINYYYFGHYITAFFTKLSGIDPAITYNLMLATLFAFCFSLTFSLTGNLIYFFLKQKFENLKLKNYLELGHWKLIIVSGLLSAALISVGANLHPAYYNFKMKILKKPYCDGSFSYWYPNATRYIGVCPDVDDKTIHEFPSYSFIVSDLHGHVSDIPFVFLFLALSLELFLFLKEKQKSAISFELLAISSPMSLILAIMYMTNQWDFPIYSLVLGSVFLFTFYPLHKATWKTLVVCFALGCLVVIPSVILILPYQFHFETLFKGVAPVHAHSLFYQLLILWGVPWFFGLTLLVFLFGHHLKPKHLLRKEYLVKWFSKLIGVEVELKKPSTNNLTLTSRLTLTDTFTLILLLVSTILIIIPEFIYVKDIYISSHHRANTMFKLTYQSFMMFSVCMGYIFVRVLSSIKKNFVSFVLRTTYCVLLLALLVYPLYSIPGYYGQLNKKGYKGLYGLQFLRRLYPDDFESVLWLNQNISDQPVVLEAVGDSYTDYERISMATGLPTIEGWLVHEWLWRGSFDEPGKRSGEVQTIYETKNSAEAKQLLDKYKVKYVIVGGMEREKYPNLNEEKFQKISKKVFQSGTTSIYELI